MNPPSRPLSVAVLGRGVVDPDEPVIHADDVGLLRGLAVFETLRVYGGRPFGMAEHLARLATSAARLGLSQVPAADVLEALARDALAAAGSPDCSLRFTLTGGRDDGSGPVGMVSVMALPAGLEDLRSQGIGLAALQLGVDPRLRRDAPWLLDGVKSTSYAVNMAAWAEARRRGADDALFVAADGSVMEGPVTNIWWRSGSQLCTPALDLGILAGVTRAHLLHLAAEAGLTVEEGWFPLARLLDADEAFTSSSVREIMPVVSVDGRHLGDGRPGRAARELQSALRRAAGAPVP
jgi:4-amino-4-deoxychorismate lyase